MDSPEAPANMERKVKELMRRITTLASEFYEKATPEQKEKLWVMLDDLDDTMVAYRTYEIVWDSKLIDVVGRIPASSGNKEVKFKTQEISTFESVMDKARDIYCFMVTGS